MLAASVSVVHPGYVLLDVAKSLLSNFTSNNGTSGIQQSKSIGIIPSLLQSTSLQYIVQFSLGSNIQPVEASIDTGSSDLWVYSSQAQVSERFGNGYDASTSLTSQLVRTGFDINYVDGTAATGDYMSDVLQLSGVAVDVEFGVVYSDAGTSQGVFGIGPVSREAEASVYQYANFPVQLKNRGYISVNSYSLYLDNARSSTGKLLFGGVDRSKYIGSLWQMPFADSQQLSIEFQVDSRTLTGILDSGTFLTYLPDDVAGDLARRYNASWDSNLSLFVADQAPNVAASGIVYSFSGAEITVPVSELFTTLDGITAFTIMPINQSSEVILLGDSFLRSAYVVYDLDNGTVALAQANWRTTIPIIIPIVDTIPGAVPAPELNT